MLTISKALSAGQAQSYHSREFISPNQSYWSRGETVRGEWQGQLAEEFGLAGAVATEEFARLAEGQHPVTGGQLVQHRQSYKYQTADGKSVTSAEHRAGWDATFSAPKSVSLTALVGGDARVRDPQRSRPPHRHDHGGSPMTAPIITAENYENIRSGIVELLKAARTAAARRFNSIMSATY